MAHTKCFSCPECGSKEYINKNLLGDGFRNCNACGQEWWKDVQYSQTNIVENMQIIGVGYGGKAGETCLQQEVINIWDSEPKDAAIFINSSGRVYLSARTIDENDKITGYRVILKEEISDIIKNKMAQRGYKFNN